VTPPPGAGAVRGPVYPRQMSGEPAESPRPRPSHRDAEGGKRQSESERRRWSEPERPGERVGPLTLTRLVKDDGRALILYTRASEGRT
jgi:hypothetical protein